MKMRYAHNPNVLLDKWTGQRIGTTCQRVFSHVQIEIRFEDGLLAGTNSSRAGGEEGIDIRNITYLDLSPQDNICITGIRETKNSSKLLRCEIANVANFELGGLARDQGGVLMSRSENRCGKRTDAPGCPSLALQPRSCPR